MLSKGKALLPVLLIAALPVQAWAGHGTIRETESGIVIYYEGDAGDSDAEAKKSALPPGVTPPQGGAGTEAARRAREEHAAQEELRQKSEAREAERQARSATTGVRRNSGGGRSQEGAGEE